MNRQIILASSSPRRIEMMRKNGIEPIIMPSGTDENCPLDLSMEQTVMFLALKKALEVENRLMNTTADLSGKSDVSAPGVNSPSVIIAADTIVYKNSVIGKPANKAEAFNILTLLCGSSHFVATGIALLSPGSPKRSLFCDVTEVFFKDYSDEEIQQYINTDEPWDKAGGYAIQGHWGKHVSHINGSYENVMGFPMERILSELSVNWPEIPI